DRAEDRSKPCQSQAEYPQVSTEARRARRACKRGETEPADGSGTLRRQEPRASDNSTEDVQPAGKHVQTWERHVWCPKLERHNRVRKTSKQWRREEQEHDRAVHCEELVELRMTLHDLNAGLKQFGTNDQRHDPGYTKEYERRNEV